MSFRREMQVALDLQAERTGDTAQLGDAERSQLGKAHAEVAKAEGQIRLVRISLGQQPGGVAPMA